MRSEELIDDVEMGKNPVYDYEHSSNQMHKANYSVNNIAILGFDPGHGSSNFGICLTQIRERRISVLYMH